MSGDLYGELIYFHGSDLFYKDKLIFKNVVKYDNYSDEIFIFTNDDKLHIFHKKKEKIIEIINCSSAAKSKYLSTKYSEEFELVIIRKGFVYFGRKCKFRKFRTFKKIMKGDKIGCIQASIYIIQNTTFYIYKKDEKFLPICGARTISGIQFNFIKNVMEFSHNGSLGYIIQFTNGEIKTSPNSIPKRKEKPLFFRNDVVYFIESKEGRNKIEIFIDQFLKEKYFIEIYCDCFQIHNNILYFYRGKKLYKLFQAFCCKPEEVNKNPFSSHPKADNLLTRIIKKKITILLCLRELNIKVPVCLKKYIFDF